jgi:hypothetical protein
MSMSTIRRASLLAALTFSTGAAATAVDDYLIDHSFMSPPFEASTTVEAAGNSRPLTAAEAYLVEHRFLDDPTQISREQGEIMLSQSPVPTVDPLPEYFDAEG